MPISRRAFSAGLAGLPFFSRPASADNNCAWASGYCIPSRPDAATAMVQAVPFAINEKSTLPRPLLSEIVKDKKRCDELTTQLASAYTQIADLNVSSPSLSRHMKDVWAHGSACTAVHDVHKTWHFLPWHRGFLYFHERLLRSVLNADDFRLPVWDWENIAAIPAPYAQWNGGLPLAIHKPRICTALDEKISQQTINLWLLTDPVNLMEFIGNPDVAGDSPKAAAGPHSLIHAKINGVMSDFDYAAADPLFFVHHANVDRYWKVWQTYYQPKLLGTAAYKLWLQENITFFDHVTNQNVSLTVDQLLHANFGSTYDPLPAARLYSFKSITVNSESPGGVFTLSAHELKKILTTVKSQTGNDPEASSSLPLELKVTVDERAAPGQYYVGVQKIGQSTQPFILGTFALVGPTQNSEKTMVSVSISREATNELLKRLTKRGRSVTFETVYGPPDPGSATPQIKRPPVALHLRTLQLRYPSGE